MQYRRWFEILVAFDCLLGTLMGAWSDETMSAYAWRKQLAGEQRGRNWVRNIDWIFLKVAGQRDHCYQAYLHDQARRALPPSERKKL